MNDLHPVAELLAVIDRTAAAHCRNTIERQAFMHWTLRELLGRLAAVVDIERTDAMLCESLADAADLVALCRAVQQ